MAAVAAEKARTRLATHKTAFVSFVLFAPFVSKKTVGPRKAMEFSPLATRCYDQGARKDEAMPGESRAPPRRAGRRLRMGRPGW